MSSFISSFSSTDCTVNLSPTLPGYPIYPHQPSVPILYICDTSVSITQPALNPTLRLLIFNFNHVCYRFAETTIGRPSNASAEVQHTTYVRALTL